MTDLRAQTSLTPDAADWAATLRSWRRRQGLTQGALAARAGLALSSVRAYEHGRRRPSQAALLSLIAALGIPREKANPILNAAGYAADLRGVLRRDFAPVAIEDLEAQAAGLPWPAFITNELFEVVAANRAARAVFEAAPGRHYVGFNERNILGAISHDWFASRVENWDEVVAFICGLVKGDQEWASADLAHPSPWLRRPLEHFFEGDPDRIRRFADIWRTAPPIASRIHYAFDLRWRYKGAERLTFSCRMALADVYTNLHWNEWVPADSATWAVLNEIAGAYSNSTGAR